MKEVESPVYGLLYIIYDTHQDDFAEFSVLSSRSQGGAQRALDAGEDNFGHWPLLVEGRISLGQF
jgi:hypothetical protein